MGPRLQEAQLEQAACACRHGSPVATELAKRELAVTARECLRRVGGDPGREAHGIRDHDERVPLLARPVVVLEAGSVGKREDPVGEVVVARERPQVVLGP